MPSARPCGVIVDRGIRVERTPADGHIPAWLADLSRRVSKRVGLGDLVENVQAAAGLAAAFRRRDAVHPFDFVHSSDYSVPGLFMRRRKGRAHMVRCSWAADLFQRTDGVAGTRVMSWLERRMIAGADAAYAPSEFVAAYYAKRFGLAMEVLRPPALLETEPAASLPEALPPRYLVFFGRSAIAKERTP